MSDEISVTLGMTVLKGELKVTVPTETLRLDMSGTLADGGTQSIGTASHEVIVITSDLGSAGWAYFKNMDATNYIEIGVDGAGTFYPLIKLRAGEACLVPLTTDVPYAKANTAACKLRFEVIEA